MHFTKEHEWIKIEGDTGICGISDYAQRALGDIVYVELPAIGKTFKQGDQIAVIESAKAASEIYAPVDGEIVAINQTLAGDPGIVNNSAEADGWMIKIRIRNPEQSHGLMDKTTYHDYIKGLA